MKIAQFKHINLDYVAIMAWPAYAQDAQDYHIDNYVRVSEWLDVTFVPCAPENGITKEVAALDNLRRTVVEEFTDKLSKIDERKAKLTAITHEVRA